MTGPERRIWIHIGTHKTGTTSIQHALATLRPQLYAAGIHVPTIGTPASNPAIGPLTWALGHHNLAWQLYGDPRFHPDFGTIEQLLAELAATACPTSVISSEDFEYLGRHPAALAGFDAGLAALGYQRSYLAFFRDAPSYLASLLPQLRQLGCTETFEELRAQYAANRAILVKQHYWHDFDRARFTAAIEAAVGPRLLVEDYSATDMVPRFLRHIGAPPDLAETAAALPRQQVTHLPRNQLCACGSGRRFKHCHGQNA